MTNHILRNVVNFGVLFEFFICKSFQMYPCKHCFGCILHILAVVQSILRFFFFSVICEIISEISLLTPTLFGSVFVTLGAFTGLLPTSCSSFSASHHSLSSLWYLMQRFSSCPVYQDFSATLISCFFLLLSLHHLWLSVAFDSVSSLPFPFSFLSA